MSVRSSLVVKACRPRSLLVIALVLACLITGTPARANSPYGSVILGGISFDRGTNGCLGPVVGVYGEDALKGSVLQTAQDYCDAQLGSGASYASAIDVEWAGATSGCDALNWVFGHGDDNEVAAAELYGTTCTTEGIPVPASGVEEQRVAVYPVEMIAQCPGATAPRAAA